MRGVATNVAVRPRRSDHKADGRAPPEPGGRKAAAGDFCVAPPRPRANSSLRRRALNSPRRRHARTSPYLWSGVLSHGGSLSRRWGAPEPGGSRGSRQHGSRGPHSGSSPTSAGLVGEVDVLERARESGVRRAIGARPRDIRFQFVVEVFALSAARGIVLGLSSGLCPGPSAPRGSTRSRHSGTSRGKQRAAASGASPDRSSQRYRLIPGDHRTNIRPRC